MAKRPLPLRIDEELLRRVDAARGDVSRTRWVERALEAALGLPSRVTSVEADRVLKDTPAEVRGVPEPYKLAPSEPSPKPAVPRSREGSSRRVQPAPVETVIRPGSPHAVPVPGVRPAREFVMDPRQAALNKAKKP